MSTVDRQPARRVATNSRRPRVRRVLMTADAVGGVWRYAVDLATALARRGVSTTLAVTGPAPCASQWREAERAGLDVVHGPYRLEWMDGAEHDVQSAGEWLLQQERNRRPDLVHLNGYVAAALPWRSPTLVVAHSCVRSWWRAVHAEPAPPAYDWYTAGVREGLRSASAVAAPTHAMLAALTAEYGVEVRGRVIANGSAWRVGPASVSPETKQPFVLAAGRAWDAAKNIDALCAVAPRLDWPVYVAGDTQDPSGAQRTLHGVQALGRLSSRALSGWYARAGIYALPARYEPFGLSVLEAARSGCALVLGDIPSLRELWEGAALFVPPEDHAGLASVLSRLIAAPEQRRALAGQAHGRAADFSLRRTADAYLSTYETLVA